MTTVMKQNSKMGTMRMTNWETNYMRTPMNAVCGDTRIFKQMKGCPYIKITHLSWAFYPSDFESKAGWQAFAVCLRCFNSAVEELDVRNCKAYTSEYGETRALLSDTLSALTELLATNSLLKKLKIDGSNCSL